MERVFALSAGYLADTHVLLWSLHGDPRLPKGHAAILASDANVHVSIATLWEIAIKVSLGKLDTVDDVAGAIAQTGFTLLPISVAHVEAVRSLPLHHRDPFDRMLIAQAKVEGLSLLTTDPSFRAYEVELA